MSATYAVTAATDGLETGMVAHVTFRVRCEKLGHGEEVFLVSQDGKVRSEGPEDIDRGMPSNHAKPKCPVVVRIHLFILLRLLYISYPETDRLFVCFFSASTAFIYESCTISVVSCDCTFDSHFTISIDNNNHKQKDVDDRKSLFVSI
jgi:hypothetical protein